MMKWQHLFLLLTMLLLFTGGAWATPSLQLPYQKQLAASPAPGVGSVIFTFTLWTAETGGISVWSETKTLPMTATRVVTSKLGETTSLATVDFSQQLWVQVANAAGTVVFGTRDKLAIAPYALWSAASGVMNWKGIYDAQLTYAKHDAVSYLGTSYISQKDGNISVPPTNWDVLAVKGDMGTTGLTGATGAIGAAGPKGDTGAIGATGSQGSIGLTGSTGAQGAQGIQGVKGDIGATGSIGLQGATGSQGTAGTNGIDGLNGKTVLNGAGIPTDAGAGGAIGDFYLDTLTNMIYGPKVGADWVGIVGVSLVGPQGLKGDSGTIGATGLQGPIGLTGPTGATGTTGTTGAAGAIGPAGPAGSSGANYTVPLARVLATGQVKSYAVGDDGDWMPGASAASRFLDNGDGTVKDNLTGLIWLKNANCSATLGGVTSAGAGLTWANALTWSNNLATGTCGLSDGSVAGQWRLPNRSELKSLVDLSHSPAPALPTGHPFLTVQSLLYWTGSSYAGSTATNAWYVNMSDGNAGNSNKTSVFSYIWPVRAGQ